MNQINSSKTKTVLREWRSQILNVFLICAAGAAGAMTLMMILPVISRPEHWPVIAVQAALTIFLVGLAAIRRMDSRIRAWGVLRAAYAMAVVDLATYGLGTSGRIYLIALPIGAVILVGVRAGILTGVLSTLTLAFFVFLAAGGLMARLRWYRLRRAFLRRVAHHHNAFIHRPCIRRLHRSRSSLWILSCCSSRQPKSYRRTPL